MDVDHVKIDVFEHEDGGCGEVLHGLPFFSGKKSPSRLEGTTLSTTRGENRWKGFRPLDRQLELMREAFAHVRRRSGVHVLRVYRRYASMRRQPALANWMCR